MMRQVLSAALAVLLLYAASAVDSPASLRTGTRLPGAVLRAIGLDRP